MSISSLNTSIAAQVTQSSTTGAHRRHDGPMAAAAKALGMSQDDLMTELKSGKSLDDIAKEKGVSQDTLNAAVKASLPPQLASSANVDDIVNQITSRKGLPHRPDGPPPGATATSSTDTSSGVYGSTLTADQKSTLDALSSLLGTDSSSLLSSLQSGTSLSDLLTSNNVDLSTVAGIMQNGLLIDTTS